MTTEVTLDPTLLAWQDTGVVLTLGGALSVTASGVVNWDLGGADTNVGPTGVPYSANIPGTYAAGPFNVAPIFGLALLLLPDGGEIPDAPGASSSGAKPPRYSATPAGGLILGPGAAASYTWDELVAMLPSLAAAPTPMRVWMIFNDCDFGDNSGGFDVSLTVPANYPLPIVNFLAVPVLVGNTPAIIISGN